MTSPINRTAGKTALIAITVCLLLFASALGVPQGTTSSGTVHRRRSAPTRSAKTSSTEALKTAAQTGTTVETQSGQAIDLTGNYDALVRFPREKINAKGTVIVDGNDFTFKSGDVTLNGEILASLNYKAVKLKYQRPDGIYDTISLHLTQKGRKIWLSTIRGEDVAFRVRLECPDSPGCMESDLCRPFCK